MKQRLVTQSKLGSLVESVVNIIIGFVINVTAQHLVFPLFGIHILFSQNLGIAVIFTVISLTRSYVLRRIFNKLRYFYA